MQKVIRIKSEGGGSMARPSSLGKTRGFFHLLITRIIRHIEQMFEKNISLPLQKKDVFFYKRTSL